MKSSLHHLFGGLVILLACHAGDCLAANTNFFANFEQATGSSNVTPTVLNSGTAIGSWRFANPQPGANGVGALSSNLNNRAAVFAHNNTPIAGMQFQLLTNFVSTNNNGFPQTVTNDAGGGTLVFADFSAPCMFTGTNQTRVRFKWGIFGTAAPHHMKYSWVRGLDAAENEVFEVLLVGGSTANTRKVFIRGAGDNATVINGTAASPQGTEVVSSINAEINSQTVDTDPVQYLQVEVLLTNGQARFTFTHSSIAGSPVTTAAFPVNSAATNIAKLEFSQSWGSGVNSQSKGFWLDDLVVTGNADNGPFPYTPASITIQTEDQRQLITDWGYDIKQPGKAAGLTPALAQNLFVADRMSVLRIPIYGDIEQPAHPASGTVIVSYYTNMLKAMTNARAANSNVMFFASKRLEGQNSFPGWVKDANGVLPGPYAEMLADYLQFLHTNGFTVSVLGVDNERLYNEGNITPSRYKDIVDNLRVLAATRGFPMPARLVAPENYYPDDFWMSSLINNGWGDRCDIVGTHYYPEPPRPLSSLRNLYNLGAPRPAWNTEVHWNNIQNEVIDDGEAALAALFDNTDVGLSAYVWWAYTRTGIKGGISQAFTASTVQTRPVTTTDSDGSAISLGRLLTRAYRDGTNLVLWAVNNTTNYFAPCTVNLDRGALAGSADFRQWSKDLTIVGAPRAISSTSFSVALPPRTITQIRFAYAPPGPDAHYTLDGDALDGSGSGNHGTLFNGPLFVPGRVGSQALAFNGSNSYVRLPRSIGGTTNFSIAFWMKTTATGPSGTQWWNGAGLVDGDVSGSADDFGVTLLNGRVAFGVGNPSTTLVSTGPVNDGQWRHVAVTRNGFDGEMRLYLDGVLNTNRFGPTGTRTAPPFLRLGSLQTGAAGGYFAGALDEVLLFNGLLEPASIAALAAVSPPSNTPPVLAAISNQVLIAGQTLNLTNNATDAEAPPQLLTYAITPELPGILFNTNTGVLNWRPTIAQSPTTNHFTVVVSDNGSPSLSATQMFTVTVLRPLDPQVTALALGDGGIELVLGGEVGPDYSLQTSTNLLDWTTLLTTNPIGLPMTLSLPVSNGVPKQFFRVLLGP